MLARRSRSPTKNVSYVTNVSWALAPQIKQPPTTEDKGGKEEEEEEDKGCKLTQVATALAKERRLVNHWGTTPTVAVKQKPSPRPKHTPWLRSRCQICVENEAPMKDALKGSQ
jgi:hypothetical protein